MEKPATLKLSKAARKLSARLLWDLFMVWVALINLGLILFDLSYLLLRPTYFTYVPVITRVYDRVKGIEPHPLTSELVAEAEAAEQLLALDPDSTRLDQHITDLERLTGRVLLENPFERSGQSNNLEVFRMVIAQETGRDATSMARPGLALEAALEFWPDDAVDLERRLAVFDQRIRPLLTVNYFRHFDLAGRLVDHFWMVDLPFLILFWIEFLSRWIISLKRKTYARWFFFPIFNWYDLLGLIPNAYFRVFRLLRAVSMYMRLRRSELSRVGKDFMSRGVAYISNIITEEVSDMVSLRILNEYQEEIRDGSHMQIIQTTLGPRRKDIEQVLSDQVRSMFTDPATLQTFRELLRLNLENAVEQSEALHSVPLPSPLVKPVVRALGTVVLDSTLEAVTTTLESREGQAAMQDLVAKVLDQLIDGPGIDEAETLIKEISLHVFEEMKERVAVKKWAVPDEDPEALAEGDGLEKR